MAELPTTNKIFLGVSLAVAFGFEFINGFHDTANAVATVIYTRTLKPTAAVLYSGFLNFLGVLLGGTAVAFSIVNLLPVDLLIDSASLRATVMVISLLLAAVIWNLTTWWFGLPISSSHTLIGSILGVGLVNSLLTRGDVSGVNWSKAGEVGLSLLFSPIIGFGLAAILLLAMKRWIKEPTLFQPADKETNPPHWIRGVLVATCGGVSFAHGSNDGQKGMGLILLVLIGFLPTHYALDLDRPELAKQVHQSALEVSELLEAKEPQAVTPEVKADLSGLILALEGKQHFAEIARDDRWEIHQIIYRLHRNLGALPVSKDVHTAIVAKTKDFDQAIEYVPYWVVICVALALGCGTCIGYQRIVVTVAEKIGKAHMSYGQGASAEVVAALTIGAADIFHLPVSTTHVLSSGVAGTMWANESGIQKETIKKIGLAWVMTLPAAILLSATLFGVGGLFINDAKPRLSGSSAVRSIQAEPIHLPIKPGVPPK